MLHMDVRDLHVILPPRSVCPATMGCHWSNNNTNNNANTPPSSTTTQQKNSKQAVGDDVAINEHYRNRILSESTVESLRRIGGPSPPTTTNLLISPTPSRDSLSRAESSTYNAVHKLVTTGVLERISYEHSGPKSFHYGVVGVRNLGNTCFLNSSIQCLSNTIPLTDYFLGYDYKKEINKNNILGTSGELVTSYAKLMKHIWLGNDSVINPSKFKRKLEQFAPQFAGGHQQDAQELLAYLLDGIHEDLNRVVHKPYVEDIEGDGTKDEVDAMVSWQRYLQRNKSVVVDVFQGQLRNTLTCTQCHYKSVKFDPFMYLSLPIDEVRTHTLDECLDLFCREEYLTQDNQWYCPMCKEHVDATKTFNLWTLPPILIVHLKRFKQNLRTGTCSKIEKGINFPIRNWDLSHAVKCPNSSSEPILYDLYAVSNHLGGFGSGHYTAYAMNRVDDQWYDFNDSKATPLVSEDLVGNGNNDAAYVLFYNRIIGATNTVPENIGKVSPIGNKRSLFSRVPVILRQSLNRPELWPQLQSEDLLRNYKRPVAASLYRRQNPHAYSNDYDD